ncbi:CHD5-like protein-domain-containing protein [Xylariaceae sp. FL1272]|nr:CHD5-like protein-domain-containing protein [Xylariaceae sp. FL1272]
MPSLLLVVLLVEVTVTLVNTIGAAAINQVLWNIYLALPTETSRSAAEKKKVQKDYLAIRRELNATSSQDQFAKWAKLRRQHDKQLEQLEKIKTSYEASKASFDRTAGIIRWTATSGVKFILPWIYGKEPMFWLPSGWFPYYVEWILSFPRAPIGSVSIVSWQTACAGVVLLLADTIKAIGNIEGLNTMVTITWGTIKSLLIFFGPILLPKAINTYRTLRATNASQRLPIIPLSPPALRSLAILLSVPAILLLSIPFSSPENLFTLTNSRLQIPTDVLFARLGSLRPLTQADEVLRSKFVNIESRLLYLQYGPDVLSSCPFCDSQDPKTYFYYALPSLLAPHLFNFIVISLATSPTICSPGTARWRWIGVLSQAMIAGLDVYSTFSYNPSANKRSTSPSNIDAFFLTSHIYRSLFLSLLNIFLSTLIYLSTTNRLFALPPDPAVRIEAVARQLGIAKSKLNALGIVKNTALRDEELRQKMMEYWVSEGVLMRELMEEREVVEGVNDALSSRIKMEDMSRDADIFATNVLPLPAMEPVVVG